MPSKSPDLSDTYIATDRADSWQRLQKGGLRAKGAVVQTEVAGR